MPSAGDIVYDVRGDLTPLNNDLAKIGPMAQKHARTVGVAMTAIGGGILAGLGGAIKSAATFQSAMAASATLGVQDLEALSDAVKDVSMTFGVDLVDGAEAAYQAISLGAKEAEVPHILAEAAKAATAAQTDLTTAIELGMSVQNAFGDSVKDVTQVYNEAFIAVKSGATTFEELAAGVGKVAPIFKAAGLSSAELFSSVAALTKGGIGTAEAFTGMKAALSGIIQPTAEASELAKVLKIDFSAVGLKTLGLKGFLDQLTTAITEQGPALAEHRDALKEQLTSLDANTEGAKLQAEAIKEYIEQLKTGMKQVKAAGGDFTKYTKEIGRAEVALKKWTKASKTQKEQIKELSEEFKDLEGVSEDTLTMLGGLFGGVEALGVVLSLSGEQAKSFNNILEASKTGTEANQEAYENLVKSDPALAFRILQAQVKVLAVEIGETLLPKVREIALKLGEWVKATIEWVRRNPELIETITKFSAALGVVMFVLGPLILLLPGLVIAGKALVVVFGFLWSWIGIIIGAIVLLIAAIGLLIWKWDEVKAAAARAWEWIKKKTIIAKDAVIGAITELAFWVGKRMGVLWWTVTHPIVAMNEKWDEFKKKIKSVSMDVKLYVRVMIDLFKEFSVAVWDAVKALGSAVFKPFGIGFGISNALGADQKSAGGPASGLTMVGEHGPEMLMLPSGSHVFNAADTASGGASGGRGGNNIDVTLNISGIGSAADNPDLLSRLIAHRLNMELLQSGRVMA